MNSMEDFNQHCVGSPYRSARCLDDSQGDYVEEVREDLSSFLNIADSSKVSFTFNATHGLNTVIQGYLQPSDHVVISCYEHNAVLRPLEALRQSRNISYTVVFPHQGDKSLETRLDEAIRPSTRLIVWNHASNVTGEIMPIDQLARWAKKHKIPLLVDVAQTAGSVPIDVQQWDVDFLVGTGHKGLLSLPGLGFLYVKNADSLKTLMQGGSGFHSQSLIHPQASPMKFEAGTPNYFAIYALRSSLKFLREHSQKISENHNQIAEFLMESFADIPELRIYGPKDHRVSIISLNIEGFEPTFVSDFLCQSARVITRAGLHCAPLAHQALGTDPMGTVRVSWGPFQNLKDAKVLVQALRRFVKEYA